MECKQSGSQRVPGTQHPAPLQARAAGAAGADGAGALRWDAPSLPPAVDRKERKREKRTLTCEIGPRFPVFRIGGCYMNEMMSAVLTMPKNRRIKSEG